MKRQFSTREKILLGILAAMLLFCFYYILVEQPVQNTLTDAAERQASAEMELGIQSVRLNKMRRMEQALKDLDHTAQADVPDYDNARQVVVLMNQAMALANEYTLTFQNVTFEGAIASRAVDMNFRCANYAVAKQILSLLQNSPYRCRIQSVSMVCAQGENMQTEAVNVRANVVFYEYLSPEQRTQK